MCTAVSITTAGHYFGRNLDIEYTLGETVTLMPRQFPIEYIHLGTRAGRYAVMGMAFVTDGYPLFYDAANEKGLCIAALSFAEAKYFKPQAECTNVASFELIPWLASNCANADEAECFLRQINITDDSFNSKLKATALHWLISDGNRSVVAESTKDGLQIYNNPVGILTNSPGFLYHLFTLNNYMGLSTAQPHNSFCPELCLDAYSRGMGAMGLPGDYSSNSRFVKAAFVKHNSFSDITESESVGRMFHILSSVQMPKGCVKVGDKYEYSAYSCCINAAKGIYYYTTYGNRSITAVDMHRENLGGESLVSYPLIKGEQVFMQN